MKLLLTFLSVTWLFIFVQAQPGTLDKNYGTGGLNYNAGPPMFIQSSTLQADNKLIAGGSDDAAAQVTFRLIRYNTDGSLDKTFGTGGIAATAFKDYVRGYGWTSVQVQPDGKIVATGYLLVNDYHNYPPYNSDIVLARFNADGTPDASFGKEGIVITDFGEYETANAMTLQKDGKILLTGISSRRGEGYDTNILTVRYNADGSLDESFGGKGYVIYLYPSSAADHANAIALQDDGKIVIAGDGINQFYCMILRYMPDGELDNSFGTNGEVSTLFGSSDAEEQTLNSVIIDKQQRIIVAGRSNEDSMTVARYNSDGSPDKSFDEDGMKIFSFSSNIYDEAKTVLLLKDERILLAGYTSGENGGVSIDLALACLQPDGSFDSSFGTTGKVTTDFGGEEVCNNAVVQTDGKIVLTGDYIQSGTGYSLIARYNGYDPGKQPLSVRIKCWLLHHGISWQMQPTKDVRYYAVQRSADGIIYKEIAKLSNKAQVNNYEDATITGSSYYRLAAIGWDGSRTYSNTVLINESAQVKMFPNPVRDNLQLQGLSAGKTSVSIVDLQGNVRSSSVANGANYSINTANLNAGNYLLKLQLNNVTTTLPFVKE